MLIMHLFVSYAHINLCHFFSSSKCQGLAATSACGSSWTFLFSFFKSIISLHVVSMFYLILVLISDAIFPFFLIYEC